MAATLLAFDDVANGGAAVSSLSTAAFDGTGTNRAVVVGIGVADTTPASPTSVTWDVATPENLSELVALTGLGYYRSCIWGLKGQTSATDTVTATFGSSMDDVIVIGHSCTGVDQTTAFGNTQSGSGTSTEPNETLTSVTSDDLCIDFVLWQSTSDTATAGANQTKRGEAATGAPYVTWGASSTQAGADGGVMTWTISNAPPWVHVAVVVKGIAAGVTTAAPAATPRNVGFLCNVSRLMNR